MTDLFFIETAEVMETIAPMLCMQDMHALMQQVCDVARSKKPSCFKIQNGTPADMAAMLAQWQYNLEGVPAAIRQEDDGSLNTSDVNIWMWLRADTPSKGVMVKQCILQLFSEDGQWASLINTSNLPATNGSKLVSSIEYLHMALKAM